MEETNTPMFKSTRPMESQMDEILSESKDPVSGNTAPVGAMPAEVRDDIPIMASPNEFMIDAATRRYYGTAFFEGLQDAAKQGFQRIKKGEESFFRDDELEVEEAAQKVSSGGSPQQMQEGGEVVEIENRVIPEPVGGGYGGYGGAGATFTGFEYKMYIHPTQPEIQIIFFQGRPLSPIPSGYVPKSQGIVDTVETVGAIGTSNDDGGSDPRDPPPTWATTPLSDWDNKMWVNYGSRRGVGVDPLGKIIGGMAAVALTGGGALFTGPTFINKMESESVKKAEEILKSAQGKLKNATPEMKKIYQAAIEKANAEIALVKEKKPFSIKDMFGFGSGSAGFKKPTTPEQDLQNYRVAYDDDSANAHSDWLNATDIVNSLHPSDDPFAYHAAIKAQSDASRAFTALKRAETAALAQEETISNSASQIEEEDASNIEDL